MEIVSGMRKKVNCHWNKNLKKWKNQINKPGASEDYKPKEKWQKRDLLV